jgi:hypothetical protein
VNGYSQMRSLTEGGPALCLAQPWRVRWEGGPEGGRGYAGIFTFSPPLPSQAAPGAPRSANELRARRGSDYLFRTTLALYAGGVLEAEAASLRGQARAALLRVVAHDEAFSRHPGRPVCDTTHCQAFKGTVPPRREDGDALAGPELPWRRWLLFSAGGEAPWERVRPLSDVEAVLGAGFRALRFEEGRAQFSRPQADGKAVYDMDDAVPCEALRAALQLPSCPESALVEDGSVRFQGRGRGHGQGLDVEAAEKSGLDQDEILRRAYGGVGQRY